MATNKIQFAGIDSCNRPVFKSLTKDKAYYGSLDTLFSLDVEEDEVT